MNNFLRRKRSISFSRIGNSLYQKYDCNVKISDLVRCIRTVQVTHVSKVHDETPLSKSYMDAILPEYMSSWLIQNQNKQQVSWFTP